MYPLTLLTASTVSLPTSPLPLRLVLHHHLLVPGNVADDGQDDRRPRELQIEPKTTSLSQLLKTIDIYRDDGRPLKIGVEMRLGGKVVSCGELGGAADRVRDWFDQNLVSLGLSSVSDLSTDADGHASFTLHPTRSSIAPSNPSSRPSGRLVAFDIALHWGRKINKKLSKKKKSTVDGVEQVKKPGLPLEEDAVKPAGHEMSDEEKRSQKDSMEEYFAVYGKSLSGPNMSTGAIAVLDKAMLQLVRFKLGRNYSFIFNDKYLENLDLQLPYLESIVGSISAIISRADKSTRRDAKGSYSDVNTSNRALVRSTRASLRELALGKRSSNEPSSDIEDDEDDAGRPLPDEDEQIEESQTDDSPAAFRTGIKEGLARVYLNQIKPGYIAVTTPSKPEHPRPLAFAPLVPGLPASIENGHRAEPLDDPWDFDMLSQSSNDPHGDDDGASLTKGSNALAHDVVPLETANVHQSRIPALLPDWEDELTSLSPTPEPEAAPVSRTNPPELLQWDSDDDGYSQGSASDTAGVEAATHETNQPATGAESAPDGEDEQRVDAVPDVPSSAHEQQLLEQTESKAIEENWAALYDD